MDTLTQQEIESWDKNIELSKELDVARRFYPKIGKPEKVKEVFINA